MILFMTFHVMYYNIGLDICQRPIPPLELKILAESMKAMQEGVQHFEFQKKQHLKFEKNFNLTTVSIRSPKRICQITNLCKKIVHDSRF